MLISQALVWLPLVAAQKVGLRSELGFGCWNAAFKYDFGCPVELPYNCRCANDNFLATAFACVYLYGNNNADDIDAGYDYIQAQCHYWGNRTMTPQEMDGVLRTKLDDIVDEGWLNVSGVASDPVFCPQDLFDQQFQGAREAKFHYNLGTYFGVGMVGFWGVVNLLAVVGNLTKMTRYDAFNHIFGNKLANWYRHTFTLPPAVGNRHHVPHRILGIFTINAPTRGQSVVVFLFLIINVASLCVFYDTSDTDKPLMFVTNGHKIMRYTANRTGLIAFALIPCIVLFASRNNPLITLTGWSYDTFQMYHRWCARMMTLHAFIHAALMTWYSAEEHVLFFKWEHVFNWPAGNLAAYFMIIMVVFALKSIRNRVDYGWLGWIIAAAIIYFVEYVARGKKVVDSGWVQEAEFSIAAQDMYRVCTTKKRDWTFSAGQFAYIRVLHPTLFWQEHPFSLFKGTENHLELMCKAKNGATKKIYNMLEAAGGKKTFKVMIEGPYGREHNLKEYDSVFVLAGGVGITAMYSYIVSVAPVLREDQCLTLIWVLKNEEYVQAHYEEIAHLATLRQMANIKVYLTRGNPPPSAKSKDKFDDTDSSSGASIDLSNVLYFGRPKVNLELGDFIEQATGSIAICACGPPSFVDGARETIVERIRKSESLIHYFEEAFSW